MGDLDNQPLFGSNRYVLNRRKAWREGYRVFRATHSCGCCTVEMAFLNLTNIRIQFDMPKFADTVRDDMGVVHECVNTGRGFVEIKRKVHRTVQPKTPVVQAPIQEIPRTDPYNGIQIAARVDMEIPIYD